MKLSPIQTMTSFRGGYFKVAEEGDRGFETVYPEDAIVGYKPCTEVIENSRGSQGKERLRITSTDMYYKALVKDQESGARKETIKCIKIKLLPRQITDRLKKSSITEPADYSEEVEFNAIA